MADVVDRQLRACNGRDTDAFVACYSDAIVIENGKSDVVGPLGDDVHAVAIYRIADDGSIDHVRFLR